MFAQSAPPNVTLVTSDIDNFWKAYDAGSPGNREEAFAKLYLEPGSPGLQDFLKSRITSAKQLAATVDSCPKFYAGIRANTLQVESQRPGILRHLTRYKELYPDARFPTVYFLIGRLNSGGTISSRGLLIGTEVFSLGEGVDAGEINPSFRRAMGPIERLPLIVVHELTHTQVNVFAKSKIPPMLSQILNEGAADFMTDLVANSTINAHLKEYAESRREELFQRFAQDMAANPKDTSKWMYNYGSAGAEPADLGYWIGREICRSYYDQAPDKVKAVRNIVRLDDTEAIVRGSRYAWLLDGPK